MPVRWNAAAASNVRDLGDQRPVWLAVAHSATHARLVDENRLEQIAARYILLGKSRRDARKIQPSKQFRKVGLTIKIVHSVLPVRLADRAAPKFATQSRQVVKPGARHLPTRFRSSSKAAQKSKQTGRQESAGKVIEGSKER
jgi:hypothetical protein